MSSVRFRRLVQDAWYTDNVSLARDAFEDYYNKHCLYPKRILITDNHTNERRFIDVACGVCEHCRATKINEWCTRMYAHAEDFKHVYFITLTYRSITNPELSVNKLLLNKLVQAVWHKDAYNSTKHFCYRPCLLVKSHYQNFLKRLRKNTGIKDITYVLSGEYGHKYGAPHFHMILFSNSVITKEQVCRAWSVALWKKNGSKSFEYRKNQKLNGVAYDFPIGRVDYNDLVSNGTFNTTAKIRVDGTYLNAFNCFAYVCKYVVKRESANLNRVILAYKRLFRKQKVVDIFGNEVSYRIAGGWLRTHGYTPLQADTIINNNLKSHCYEKITYQPSQNIFEHGLLRSKRIKTQNLSYNLDLLPSNLADFRSAFSPFCEFSRGTPIGSIYAKNHLQEFKEGIFNKPLLQDKGFVIPSYFRTKANESLFGLRRLRKTIKSTSLVLSNLPDLYRHFSECLEDGSLPRMSLDNFSHHKSVASALQDDRTAFVDKSTGERIILANGLAQGFRYNRSQRCYVPTSSTPVVDWLRYWCVRMSDEFKRNLENTARAKQNRRDEEAAHLMLLDFGDDMPALRRRFEQKREQIRKDEDKLYHSLHQSAE